MNVSVPILEYHIVRDNAPGTTVDSAEIAVIPSEFDKQMKYLADNNYKTYFLSELIDMYKTDKLIPEKSILITFDDGARSVYTNAFPILKKYNLKFNTYLITKQIGVNTWTLTWDMVKEMQTSGLVEIGSHTANHTDLTNTEDIFYEINQSTQDIQQYLGITPNTFAYPYGAFNESSIEILKNNGYIAALTTETGKSNPLSNYFLLPRLNINRSATIEQFEAFIK